MNRDCHGDWVPKLGLYRCFLNGKFIPDLAKKPTVCPNCHRAVWAITRRRPKLRSLLMMQIKLGDTYHTYEIIGTPNREL